MSEDLLSLSPLGSSHSTLLSYNSIHLSPSFFPTHPICPMLTLFYQNRLPPLFGHILHIPLSSNSTIFSPWLPQPTMSRPLISHTSDSIHHSTPPHLDHRFHGQLLPLLPISNSPLIFFSCPVMTSNINISLHRCCQTC